MNEEELKRLIQRYYNGISTEEEENTLREFFRKGKIPRGYEAEKVIFGYYNEPEAIPEPSHDFEVQILAAIDASERKTGIRRYMIPLISAAAGILILFGSYFFFSGSKSEDTFTDPRIAYMETLKILHVVSAQLNDGARTLEPVGKMNEIMRETINNKRETTNNKHK